MYVIVVYTRPLYSTTSSPLFGFLSGLRAFMARHRGGSYNIEGIRWTL